MIFVFDNTWSKYFSLFILGWLYLGKFIEHLLISAKFYVI